MRYEIILKNRNNTVLESHRSRTIDGLKAHYKRMTRHMCDDLGGLYQKYYQSHFEIIDHQNDHTIEEYELWT